MCDEWIYMWLSVNMCFSISWGTISVGRASALHAENHLLDSCILQPNLLPLAPQYRTNIDLPPEQRKMQGKDRLCTLCSDHQTFLTEYIVWSPIQHYTVKKIGATKWMVTSGWILPSGYIFLIVRFISSSLTLVCSILTTVLQLVLSVFDIRSLPFSISAQTCKIQYYIKINMQTQFNIRIHLQL